MIGVFVQMNEDSPKAKSNPIGYVIQENGCWEWVGAHKQAGYGQWGRTDCAHRVMYEKVRGPIPKWLHLDHLCRNKGCVNPDHLEAVTQRENTLRGESPAAQRARATHCKNGHPYDGTNTYNRPDRPIGRGRYCRACRRVETTNG